jgi:DNA-binding MarR family transcriptional regulator
LTHSTVAELEYHRSQVSVATSETALARETWTAMLEFFFSKGRPRMLELWREFDLMPPQQMVLGLLDEPRPMGELAQHMHCDNSNITGIVDRLEERGLVERRAAEGDRRVKIIALTKAGEALRAELDRRRSEPPPELAALSQAELKKLRAVFAKLAG